MSSRQYSTPDHQNPPYQLDGASYHSIQQTVNPSQSHTFAPYESQPQSPTVSYEATHRGYGSHIAPSNPASPIVSHRPTPSPGIQTTFVLPPHLQTISPTALYQHQTEPSLPHPPARSRSYSNPHHQPHSHSHSHSNSYSRPPLDISVVASPISSPFPSYPNDYSTAHLPQQLSEEDYQLPDPHAHSSRPQLSVSVSGGLVGHPEGWNDHSRLDSSTSEIAPSNPTPSPRSRAASLGGKKKKASPRTTTVPLPARKRSPASCAPCRKKKLKCDRSLPCSSCIAKGSECIWEGDATPLYIKDEHEQHSTKELQAQVDRLQALVDELANSPKSSKTSLKFDSMTASEEASIDSSPTFELLAHDLPQALVELALVNILPPQQVGELAMSPASRATGSFLENARSYCKNRLQNSRNLGSTSLITPSASSSEVSPSSSIFPPVRAPQIGDPPSAQLRRTASSGTILESIPPFDDIEKTSSRFFDAIDVLVPLVDRSKFVQSNELLRQGFEESADVNLTSVALIVAVASSGLSKMSDQEASTLSLFGDRISTLDRWLDIATSALSLSTFTEYPTYDGIRATLIIASTKLSRQGRDDESYTAATSLLHSAIQASFALELHREPNRNGKTKYRFSECQERRRLFWALFSVCSSLTTDTSRIWTQLDLRYIDTHFPLDCFDDELAMDELAIRASVRARVNSETFEETPMTLNLCLARLAFVSKKISEEAFVIGGCRYSKISTFHAELRKLEKSLPDCYRAQFDEYERPYFASPIHSPANLKAALVQVSVSAEIVRLNRPFLVLAATDERYQESRERAVLHAKRVLSIATDPICKSIVSDLLLKILSSAVVLGIELVQSPDESDSETLRGLIAAAQDILGQHSRTSLIAAQGGNVLRFLLEQGDASTSATSSRRHRAKRPRMNQHSPDEVNFQLRQSWLHSIPNSTYPSRAGSPGSDSEIINVRRKTTRPVLKHSARSESHLSSRARLVPRPPPLARTQRSHSAEDFPPFESVPLPLSPATTHTSAPSVVAPSPVINFDESQQQRNRTFSGPASSSHLSDMSATNETSTQSMFRYYNHPTPQARADYRPPLESGLGLIDFAHHGRPLPAAVPFGDSEPTTFFQHHLGERMDTEDLQSFDHSSSTIEDYPFAPIYRHS